MASGTINEKENLESTVMQRYRLNYTLTSLWGRLKWDIPNFHSLRDNVCYTGFYEPYGWKFSFIKRKRDLKVTIDMRNSSKVANFISFGLKEPSITYFYEATNQIDARKYQVVFPSKIQGKKIFMEKTTYRITFTIMGDTDVSYTCQQIKSDAISLSQNLENLYSNLMSSGLYQDFLLRGEYYAIPVHKSILATRSLYFSEHFKCFPDAEETELKIPIEILSELLEFIYTGKMKFPTSWKHMTAVMKSAADLGITSLRKEIINHLKSIINDDNAQDIKELGLNTKLETLVQHVNNFLKTDESVRVGR